MYNPHELSHTSKAILETMTQYHAERLHAFERDQARRRSAQYLDGNYSLTRLLHAQGAHEVLRLAPQEAEISRQIAEDLGRPPEPGYEYVPYRRDLSASVAAAGGYLVETETAPGNVFVGALLAMLGAAKLGMPIIPMQGNASFPSVSGTVTVGWLAGEGALLTESDLAFAAAAGTPKGVGGYTEVSGQALKQTGLAAQNFVLTEIARAVKAELGKKIVNGSGASGQPTGILNTAGIGSVSGASFSWAIAQDVVHAVENADAVVNPKSLGWAMPPTIARDLRKRERDTGTQYIIDDANRLAGYPVDSTNSMPAATALFGDWSGVALLEWGALQIAADPYGVNSALFVKNLVGIRALWTCDVVVLRAKSFCKSESIT